MNGDRTKGPKGPDEPTRPSLDAHPVSGPEAASEASKTTDPPSSYPEPDLTPPGAVPGKAIVPVGLEWTGSSVKKLRGQLRLSQRELARLLGVSGALVARWEGEGIEPNPAHVRLLWMLNLRAQPERTSVAWFREALDPSYRGQPLQAFFWLMGMNV